MPVKYAFIKVSEDRERRILRYTCDKRADHKRWEISNDSGSLNGWPIKKMNEFLAYYNFVHAWESGDGWQADLWKLISEKNRQRLVKAVLIATENNTRTLDVLPPHYKNP